MSISPTMSSRAGSLPITKVSSSENICAKSKEDRKRGNFSKHPGNYQEISNNACYSNAKGANNHYQKQPRAKSCVKACGGRRNQVKAERRDAFSPLPVEQHGSKKTNMNHLLNFTFDSSYNDHKYAPRGKVIHGWKPGSQQTVFNKEQFIQANCQLVVKEGLDYSAYCADADIPIDWDLVEKVNMWSHETPSCPICLESPNAARVTKCGHIFCWPCILHYLALETKPWRKCPICHEAVHQTDLKRYRGSMIAYPADKHEDSLRSISDLRNFVGTTKAQIMSQRNFKFLHATSGQVITNIVQVEMEQLEFRLATESDDLEKQFIIAALDLCKQRQADLLSSIEKKQQCAEQTSTNTETVTEKGCVDKQPEPENNSSVCLESSLQLEKTPDSPNDHVYYFYQAKDGQHIYLHPVNVKCLIHEYGSFDQCPMEITGKILETEDLIMNEAMRKRHRYLAHLPISLEFHVTELDLRPPVLQKATLDLFHDHLERRATQRKRKAREEKKVLRKVHNAEMRKQGKYPSARISLESQKQFPNFPGRSGAGPSSFSVLLPSSQVDQCETPHDNISEPNSSTSVSPLVVSASSSLENTAGPSFAQMLRSAKTAEQQSWSRICPSSSQTSQTSTNDVVDDDPDYVAPPSYQSSFGDALTSALSRLDTGASEENERGKGKKGRGKKKGKKVLLFSTAGHQLQ